MFQDRANPYGRPYQSHIQFVQNMNLCYRSHSYKHLLLIRLLSVQKAKPIYIC